MSSDAIFLYFQVLASQETFMIAVQLKTGGLVIGNTLHLRHFKCLSLAHTADFYCKIQRFLSFCKELAAFTQHEYERAFFLLWQEKERFNSLILQALKLD